MGRLLTTRQYGANIVAVMKPSKDANGYYRTMMDGRTVKVHRVVAENWLKNPTKLECVNHLDCNRANNRVENLEWCSRKYNAWWGIKMGTMKAPEWKGKRGIKLMDKEKEQVREYYRKEIAPLKTNMEKKKAYDKLQEMFPNITKTTLQDIAYSRASRSRLQSLTIPSVCEKHHTHIVSEENIIL